MLRPRQSYQLLYLVRAFPGQGYSPGVYHWAIYKNNTPYGSLGNGSAMRVSPIGVFFNDVKKVIIYAIASAATTHNHPEGIKGAVVTAVSVWMALNGYSKEVIYNYMKKHYHNIYGFVNYNMAELKYPNKLGKSDATCMFAVPAAIICFYYANNYEETINNCLSFAGDTDTIGAIAGGIAGAYYGVPENIILEVEIRKPEKIFDEAIAIIKKELFLALF